MVGRHRIRERLATVRGVTLAVDSSRAELRSNGGREALIVECVAGGVRATFEVDGEMLGLPTTTFVIEGAAVGQVIECVSEALRGWLAHGVGSAEGQLAGWGSVTASFGVAADLIVDSAKAVAEVVVSSPKASMTWKCVMDETSARTFLDEVDALRLTVQVGTDDLHKLGGGR